MAQTVKNLPAMQETQVQSLGREDSWRRKWQSAPVLLLGEFHGQRGLTGYSPWGHKESDKAEQLTLSLSLSGILHILYIYIYVFSIIFGEGNGNPLQCFCLENPRDGGAWWAVVFGVAQSRTRLK